MRRGRKRLIKDIGLILAAFIISYMVFCQYDVLEMIVRWSRQYEEYEIDELVSSAIVLLFLVVILLVNAWRRTIRAKNSIAEKNGELRKAMDEIAQLKRILPICSYCKKVRDDSGYWEQVDIYMKKQSLADVSHSICPECTRKYYPEEYALLYPQEGEKKTD